MEEFDVVTENRVHDSIKGHERAPKKLAIVKRDTHTVGRHVDRDRAKDRCQGTGVRGRVKAGGAGGGTRSSKDKVQAGRGTLLVASIAREWAT